MSAAVWANVIASSAFTVACYAAVQSRKSVKAAERSASAAEDSERHAERSAVAAEDSARSSERISDIEALRHKEERRPKWDVAIMKAKRGYTGPPRLELKLLNAEVLEEVVVVAIDQKLSFRDGQEGVEFEGDSARSVGPVLQGRSLVWHVRTPQPPQGGFANVEVMSRHGEYRWVDVYEVKLPSPPPRAISY